jgi:actin-like ATPase involved in cell morphogenesis
VSYFLGIDLGTTYTAAAVWRDGRVEIAGLGSRAPVIPSVVLVRANGEVLTGEVAERRAVIEPQRIAREFKRRVGDPTPLFVGGAPYSAEALTALLLRAVVDRVIVSENGTPAGIGISHPANWGAYKQDLLRQAIRRADLDDVVLVSEPEAAAIHYTSQSRVEPNAVVAVYDLGGGTFDAAVLRRTTTGWDILGEPEGVERLGGVDFDQAVLHHVIDNIGEPYERLDPSDPTTLAAVTRLRQECVEAKEALASDTDATIPVLLPTVHTEVRLTRPEFEDMIRPALNDSIAALHRALRTARVSADEVGSVLLVGGSSRIPLVAQLVGSAFVRPVAVDAHPKHGVALGAAILAADQVKPGAVNTSAVESVVDATPAPMSWMAPATASASSVVSTLAPASVYTASPPPPRDTTSVFRVNAPYDNTMVRSVFAEPPSEPLVRTSAPHPALPSIKSEATVDADQREVEQRRRRALGLVTCGFVALLVALVGAAALGHGDDDGRAPSGPGGAPVNVSPEGVESDPTRPMRSTTTTLPPVLLTPDGELTPVTEGTTPTTALPRTTTPPTEPTTTTESTTTTEPPTTTTTQPPETTTTTGPHFP